MKKITAIRSEFQNIPLKTPFITALRRVESVEFVRLFIECDDGAVGIGEAPSTLAITGEDIYSIKESVEKIKDLLIGLSLSEALKMLHKQTIGSSAKAALDMAIVMLQGKNIIRDKESIKTDITISLNAQERMIFDAKAAVRDGMDILKVKFGSDINHALCVTEALALEVPEAKLLIDANQAWSVDDALLYVKSVANLPIELIEQPVKANDLDGLKSITEVSTIPILADEAAFTLEDVKQIVESKSADMINIKLMKCGGVSRAVKILEYAREQGVVCMLGSMLEGPYSISAALYLAFNYRDVIKYVDLDSPLLYKKRSEELQFNYRANEIFYAYSSPQSSISPLTMESS